MVENNINMDKFQKRAVIKYRFLKRMSGKAIHDDMLATLSDNTPVYSVVKIWLAEFKRGRNSIQDEHYLGCPKDAPSTENLESLAWPIATKILALEKPRKLVFRQNGAENYFRFRFSLHIHDLHG